MSELSFNLSSSDLEANSLPPILSRPAIANCKLKSVVVETVKEQYEIVDFNFELLEGEHKGHQFRHRVFGFKPYAQSEKTPEEDMENWGKHVGFVMSFFIGEENALKILNGSENWAQMREHINSAFKAPALIKWKEKIVKLKILGYVNGSGKAVLGFPRYLGFISDAESATQVTFSKRELQQNAEYGAAYAREISATGSAELASNGESGGAIADVETGMDF